MKRRDFSSEDWEERVLRLLSSHPDTVAVTDLRQHDPDERRGADGIWIIRQDGRSLEVPFAIHVARPGTREVGFEIAEHHGRDAHPGAALSEVIQLFFVCAPDSDAMLTVPAHEVRDLLAEGREYARSSTQVGRDAKGPRLSERFLVPLDDLALLHSATVSTPESW